MSVERLPGGKGYRARLWITDPHTGKKRQTEKRFTAHKDAVRWEREQKSAQDKGTFVDPQAGTVTLLAYFETWAARQIWADGTRKAMSLAVRRCDFADLPLRSVKHSHVEAWVKSMSVRLAPGTVKTRLTNVRSVLRAAVLDQVIAADPSARVRAPRQRRREAAMTIPAPADVYALLGGSQRHHGAFWAVCAFAGLRLGEAAGLRLEDIDWMRREIRVRRQVQRGGKGRVVVTPPKHGSERDVPVPDHLLSILSDFVREVGVRDSGYLFQLGGDNPPHQNTVGYWWRTDRARAGLSGFVLHDLRHFYASGLIASGADVVTVQRALGHASAKVTLDTYSHLWPTGEERTRKAAAALMEEVFAADRRDVGPMWGEGGA